ncbi:MAG: TolB family protein [Actinomycetota bacterium]
MTSRWTIRVLVAALACLATATAAVAQSPTATTERVSVRSNGVEGNDDSFGCSISGDGNFAGFASRATNLIGSDRNGATDVFLFNRRNTTPEFASIRSTGAQANRSSEGPSLSHTGRYVAFTSSAGNLAIKGDHNGVADVFVYDRNEGKTNRISIRSNLAEANGTSYDPAIAANGRFVAFTSTASNLAIKGDNNRAADIFVHDRTAVKTNRVSISSKLKEGNGSSYSPSISGDGRMVAFLSYASNLVSRDTNRMPDVFVYNRATRKTIRVSIASDGSQADGESSAPMISADGGYVAFHSGASNLVEDDDNDAVDVFVHDLSTGETERISTGMAGAEPDGGSIVPAISADGRYVAFQSYAQNLVPGDTNGAPDRWNGLDVFRYDRVTGEMQRVSVGDDNEQANGPSNDPGEDPSITADGRFVCFASAASNLVDDDTNNSYDVFVRGPLL